NEIGLAGALARVNGGEDGIEQVVDVDGVADATLFAVQPSPAVEQLLGEIGDPAGAGAIDDARAKCVASLSVTVAFPEEAALRAHLGVVVFQWVARVQWRGLGGAGRRVLAVHGRTAEIDEPMNAGAGGGLAEGAGHQLNLARIPEG